MKEWLLRRTQVLSSRNFGLYYTGYVSSLLGSGMSTVAMAWAVLDSGATAVGLGAVMAATVVPQVVLMAFAGAIADRYGRRRMMLAADLGRTLSQGVLAAALLLPEPFAGRPPLWLFVGLAAIRGVGQAFYSPAMSALTAEIAPRDKLGDANAMYQMGRSIATVAGPALGGVLVAVTSPGVVVAIDSTTFGISVLMLSLLKLPSTSKPVKDACDKISESAARAKKSTIWAEMGEGWRDFRSRSWLWIITLQFAFFNLITWSPWMVLGPVLARQYLGGAAAWGAVMAAEGGGAIIAGVLLLGRRPRRPMLIAMIGAICFALPDIPMALYAPAAWVAAAAFISGVGDTVFNVFLAAAMQQQVPTEKLARVSAFTDFPAFGIGVIGYLIEGTLSSTFGPTTLFAAGAIYGIASSALILTLPAIRSVPWRGDDGAEEQESLGSPTLVAD